MNKLLKNRFSSPGIFNRLFFSCLKFLGYRLLRLFFAFEVENIERIPDTGPFIVTANHFSFMDPAALQAACPRRIFFLMTEKYYNPIWGRWFFKLMYAIPLREDTSYNISALKTGLKVLAQGKVIGIFPEGGISLSGMLREGRPGALLLAQRSGASVIPAFISGTFQALPKGSQFFRKAKIKVIFGNPISYEELSEKLNGEKGLDQATKNLMGKIEGLADKT